MQMNACGICGLSVRVAISIVLVARAALPQTAIVEPVSTAPAVTPLGFSVNGRTLPHATQAHRPFGTTRYIYQWPGTYFEAAFTGTEVYFRLDAANHQILHVVVDSKPPVPLLNPVAGVYRVHAQGAGKHVVRVQTVTESQAVTATFGGFALPRGATALPPPKRGRAIEFVGDSYTLGYGNASPKRECKPEEVMEATDTSRSFVGLTADHYGAGYSVFAISGRGVVRNFNGYRADTIPAAYPYRMMDKKLLDGAPSVQPQVAIVGIGTNDLSKALRAGEKWKTPDALHADFEASYVAFLKKLRARYPGAYFVVWATDEYGDVIRTEANKVVQQWKAAGETKVDFVPVGGLQFTACDWHPSLADDRVIYGKLAGFLDAHPQIWQGK
jgi:lysophospholipase L1-like esterase